MMLSPNGSPPTCPICGKPLSGAVCWPGNGDIWCNAGHYRGYAWSSFREPGPIRLICDPEDSGHEVRA